MKKLLSAIILIASVVASQAEMYLVHHAFTNVSTNTSVITYTNAALEKGFVESVIVNITNQSALYTFGSSSNVLGNDSFIDTGTTTNGATVYKQIYGAYMLRNEGTGTNVISTNALVADKSGDFWQSPTTDCSGTSSFIGTNYVHKNIAGTDAITVSEKNQAIDLDILATDALGIDIKLLSIDDVSDNGYYPTRVPVTSVAGGATTTVARQAIYNNKIKIKPYNAHMKYTDADIYVIIEQPE